MRAEQLPLFPPRGVRGERAAPLSPTPELTPRSSLKSAIGAFHAHMLREGFTENTIKAFRSDLRLLERYLGGSTPVGEITTSQLQDFLTWLLEGRGVPCSPKSYARRITTLKRFFAWLNDAGVIALRVRLEGERHALGALLLDARTLGRERRWLPLVVSIPALDAPRRLIVELAGERQERAVPVFVSRGRLRTEGPS